MVDALTDHDQVMVDANSAAHSPISHFRRIPPETDSRAKKILHGIGKHLGHGAHGGLRNLLIEVPSCSLVQGAKLESAVSQGM